MNKITILFLISVLYVQDWMPFHPFELDKNYDIELDYSYIDRLAANIPLNQLRQSLSHEIIGYLPYWKYDQYPYLDYNLLTQINYFSAELNEFGDIVNNHNWQNLSLVEFAHERGVKVKLCATLFGENQLRGLLSSPFNRQNAINNLLQLVMSKGADGVDIDFELVPVDQRDNLVLFMEELSFIFHTNMGDPIITMATPAVDWSNAWDYESLAEITDGLFIMGYNYFYSGSSSAGPVSPLGGYYYDIEYSVDDYINKTSGQLDKLILGLPYYGYDWPVVSSVIGASTTGYGIAKTYSEAESITQQYEYNWDSSSSSAWVPYQTNNWYQCWYDDSLSLSIKYQFAIEKDIKGIGIWALGYDQNSDKLWGAISDKFNLTLIGDINFDQEVNIQDVIIIINSIVIGEPYQSSADINNDYMVNVLDVVGIVNIILNN